MQRNFASDKFLGNMKIAVLSMVVSYSSSLLDYFLVGQVMGEKALQAFALLTPYLSIIFFVSCLVSSGTAIMSAFEVGKGSREHGNHFFQQGVISAVGIGVLLSLILFLCKGLILGSERVPSEVMKMMEEYYIYICLLPVWHILSELLFAVIWNAGGDRHCAIAIGLKLFVNIFASVILMHYIGIGGTGLGTVLGCVAEIAVLFFYFRTPENVFQWGWYFDIKSVMKMFHFGSRDAMIYLYMAVLQFVMNLFLLKQFGSEAILIFSVLMNLENLYVSVFNAPSNAISVILTVYVGEGNRKGILKSMKTAERTAALQGIIAVIVLFIFARRIPMLFGIHNSASIEATKIAVRIFALSALVYPFIMLYSTYYLAIKRVALSMRILTMQILIMPMVFGILLSYSMGLRGVWIGFSLGSIFMFLLDALLIKLCYRDRSFPHLLNEKKLEKQLSYDVPISKEGVMSLVDQVEQDLKSRGVESKKVYRIMLMIEETEMLVVERNGDKGGIIQCDLFFEEQIRLVLRDNGLFSDVTDQDNEAESFRAYAATMIGGNYGANKYIVAWGNNRTVCWF